MPYFLPYQQAWIDDPAKIAVVEKSRRVGLTYAEAYRSVQRRVRLGTHHFFASRDLPSAAEFIEYCKFWARIFDLAAADEGEGSVDDLDPDPRRRNRSSAAERPRTHSSAHVLRFPTGARIVALSSNPDAFRSRGGDVTLDEFAFHPDPAAALKAATASAAVWGHTLRIISTHNGQHSVFFDLIHDIRNGRRPDISLHRITLPEAVDQGLVEKIRTLPYQSPPEPDPAARRQFLTDLRSHCLTEDEWQEEYLCTPSANANALLSYDLIQSCESPGCALDDELPLPQSKIENRQSKIPAPPDPTTPPPHNPITSSLPTPHLLYAGFDLARHHDLSALWVLEPVADVFWTRQVRTFPQVAFSAQEETLNRLMENRAVARLCLDATGMGAMLAERLRQRWGSRVEPITFTAAIKSDLALPLVRLFRERRIRIPADPAVRDDLHAVRKTLTTAGHSRLDAARSESGHADRFWALALAHHAAQASPNPLPAPLRYKPMGW